MLPHEGHIELLEMFLGVDDERVKRINNGCGKARLRYVDVHILQSFDP
jgi:hypothetical protein